jgi:hypothetical protein
MRARNPPGSFGIAAVGRSEVCVVVLLSAAPLDCALARVEM